MCDECGRRTNTESAWRTHLNEDHPNEASKYIQKKYVSNANKEKTVEKAIRKAFAKYLKTLDKSSPEYQFFSGNMNDENEYDANYAPELYLEYNVAPEIATTDRQDFWQEAFFNKTAANFKEEGAEIKAHLKAAKPIEFDDEDVEMHDQEEDDEDDEEWDDHYQGYTQEDLDELHSILDLDTDEEDAEEQEFQDMTDDEFASLQEKLFTK